MTSENLTIKELVDAIIADGQLTEEEQKRLNEAMLADGKIDDFEVKQINRVMDMIKSGALKVVGED